MDSRHPRVEETVKMKWPRSGAAFKQAVARSMDRRPVRRMLSVKLGQTRSEEQVKLNYILAKEKRGTECTEEVEPVLAWPARPEWKSSQASGLGRESADLGITYTDVSEGGSGKNVSVAPISVKDNCEPIVCYGKCTLYSGAGEI